MAFASIYVPDFSIQAVARTESALRQQPIALIEGCPPLERVVAVNEAAARAGLDPGMTKSQAMQFRSIAIRSRSCTQEQAAHAALMDAGWSVSPRVEDTAVDSIVVDLTGLDSLFGSEETIAHLLARRASDLGLIVHVAVSSNLEVALHAARGFPGITVIPPGEEYERLGALPVQVFSPPLEMIETLERWGVRTCAALAKLPLLGLSERLGQQGVQLHQWARGTSLRSMILAEPKLCFEEEMPLEYAVEELEPLAFLLGRLLDQLCARLSARSLSACAIRLRFELDHSSDNESSSPQTSPPQIPHGRLDEKNTYEKLFTLPVPMRDSKMLLRLLRLHLQSDPPRAPIVRIFLAGEPAPPRVRQEGLFLPSSPDPEKLELTIARLANLVGDSHVGSPRLMDSHRPDAFEMGRFTASHDSPEIRQTNIGAPPDREPLAAFRAFRPAPRARVTLREGRPAHISFPGMHGQVAAASGPWRTSGEWWREDAWHQDEWDVEIHRPSVSSANTIEHSSSGGAAKRRLPDLLRRGAPSLVRRGNVRLMYTELHARSAFSFLEGASIPEELAGRCAELGMEAMALLDRDGVYGAPRFHLAANKLSMQAHIGAEVTSSAGWRYALLVESRAGYQNLCRLITRMKLQAKKGEGCISAEDLAGRAAGLICLTGGEEGPLVHALIQGRTKQRTQCVQQLCHLFGRENVYIELQRHFCREEEARNQAALEIARKLSLPLVATNGVCHACVHQREVLDVFTCIRHHRNLNTAGRLLACNSERHLKSPAEMELLFSDLPEAIANTQVLASRLQFTLKDLGYQFPKYPVPEGQPQMQFLRERTYEGMITRYGSRDAAGKERVRTQMERELDLIEKLDLPGYFLIVWDIVRFCREHNILVQGRGSAANSAVCYALGITAVDPIGMDLLFERFLSEERGEWPDIDLDLPSGDQRERAIQYVYERYGKLGAAMTANVITYRGRSAAREIGKALCMEPETLNRLAGLVGAWEYKDANDTLARQFHDAGLDARHPLIRKFFDLCVLIQDLPRHLGQHSGGMVVCQGQLDSIVPLEPATMPGRVVVQWDKEDCTDMGIVKVDLLGLGMMAALEDSLKIIKRDYGEEIDLGRLPPNDPAVYDALQKADTVGMFQIESRAQMACLPRLRPKCFYDIVVQVAIIRPGPIVGKMVHPYLKRRQGREPPNCLHPSLEPVLARTLGVPLFQEQLLRMAMIAAGFTGGEAEELRRAFGFKRSEARMKDVEVKLRRGMERNHIDPETQEKIVQSIVSFALYGFPESHAASFALLAYASAYLKCHYLPAFTAALLNNEPMGFYHPATIVKDAQRHGLKVRPIDVTRSDWPCKLEKNHQGFALRLGMRYVKGLREEMAQEIVRQRALRPFGSIDDLKLRVPGLQKSELTALAEIGALNFIESPRGPRPVEFENKRRARSHRREALWQVERAARSAGPLLQECDEPEFHPESFSSDVQLPGASSPLLPMTAEERLVADFRGTGMTVGPHPMAYHRHELQKEGIRSATELPHLPDGTPVRIAGSVIARQRPGTAKGFVFLSLEDETGIANAIITPQLFERSHVVIVHQQFLVIEGKLQNQENVVSVKAESVRPLNITQAETTSHDFH